MDGTRTSEALEGARFTASLAWLATEFRLAADGARARVLAVATFGGALAPEAPSVHLAVDGATAHAAPGSPGAGGTGLAAEAGASDNSTVRHLVATREARRA